MSPKQTAAFVREAREQLGLSQTKFGERLGVTRRTVLRWEKGISPLKQRDRIAINLLIERPRAWQGMI